MGAFPRHASPPGALLQMKVVKNGSFFQRLSTLSASRTGTLFGLIRAGAGIAWNNLPQTLVWPEATCQFNGSNCGTSALFLSTISVLFLSLWTADQPLSMAQMVDALYSTHLHRDPEGL